MLKKPDNIIDQKASFCDKTTILIFYFTSKLEKLFFFFQDVKGCMTVGQISKQLNLQALKTQNWHIQACCALSGEGYIFNC
jgi:hypothetical protein